MKYSFSSVISALELHEKERTLVHAFKYKRAVYLAEDLGGLMYEALQRPELERFDLSDWILVPVPLHSRRERTRQYNQAALLSRVLARHTGLPDRHLLKRVKPTLQQARLSKIARQENLRNAFKLRRKGLKNREAQRGVLLVDDVFTTGATAEACARVLLRSGTAREVVVLTLARG